MMLLILLLVLLSSSLFFIAILQLFFLSDKRIQKRIDHYLQLSSTGKKLDRKSFNFIVQFRVANQQLKKKLVTKKKSIKLELAIKRSGVPLKPEEYMLFQLISTALLGMILYLFS